MTGLPRYCLALGLVCWSTATAAQEASAPVFIWYRSAGSCPDGEAFREKLSGRLASARLAGAGDPVDFVVTLRGDGSMSHGRLERQTQRGTVAIRELESSDCSELAEAMALSLSLAATPERASTQPDPDPEPELRGQPTAIPKRGPPPAAKAPPSPPHDPGVTERDSSSRWSIGAQALMATAIAPEALPGGAAFVDFELGATAPLPGASARAGARAVIGSVPSVVGEVRYRTVTGYLGGCPVRIGADALSVRPCVEVEVGSLAVRGAGSAGREDQGLWSAAGVSGRLTWRATDGWAFEAQIGGFAPLTRYHLVSGDPTTEGERTRAVGLSAAIGATARLP